MARLGRTSFRGLSGYCDLQIIPPCCQSPSKDRISWVRAIKLNLRALLFNYDIGREKTGDAIKVNDHRPNLRHFSSRVLTFNLKMMLGFHLMLHAAQLWHTETDSLHALRTASQEPCQRYLSAWSRNRGAGVFSCSAGDGQYCLASRICRW